MANEFVVRKGLIVNGSGSVILDVQGSLGQLFSITDDLEGSLFSVNDISGVPVLEAFSDDTVKMGTFNQEGLIVTGSRVAINTGSVFSNYSLTVSGSAFFESPVRFESTNLTIGNVVGENRLRTSADTLTYFNSSDGYGDIAVGNGTFNGTALISGSSFNITLGSGFISTAGNEISFNRTAQNYIGVPAGGSLEFNEDTNVYFSGNASGVTITPLLTADGGITIPNNTLTVNGTLLFNQGGEQTLDTGSSVEFEELFISGSTLRLFDLNGQAVLRPNGDTNSDLRYNLTQWVVESDFAINQNLTVGDTVTINGTLLFNQGGEQTLDTGSSVVFDQIHLTNNVSDYNVKIGDDVELNDINEANTLGIIGVNDSNQGYIQFGADTNPFGYNNSNLTYSGSFELGTNLDVIGTSTFEGIITDDVFNSGFGGSGWRVDTNADAEFENLTVRGTFNVYELLVRQVRGTNGSILVSNTGKIETASLIAGSDYYLTFDTGNSYGHTFQQNDIVLAQRLSADATTLIQSFLQVTNVESTGALTASLLSGDAPSDGYEYLRIGNTTDVDRQGHIYLTADDSNAPFIGVRDGVDAYTDFTSGTGSVEKVRVGKLDGVTSANFGALTGYGLWASGSVFLEGGIAATFGNIGGFGISSTTISSSNDNLILRSNGQITGSTVLFDGGTIGGFDLLSDEIKSSNNDLRLKADGEITGSNVLFDGGTIGGFEIGASVISSSGGNIVLNANGQFTASNALIQGTINVVGGNAATTSSVENVSSSLNTTISNVSSSASTARDNVSGSLATSITNTSASLSDRIVTDANNKIIKTNDTPGAGSGLYLSENYLGYYDSSAWNAYISSSGEFLFQKDADNLLSFGNNSFVLNISDEATISGSQINLITPQFFFGNSNNQYISGSNGNIEISSSKFHLQNNGDVIFAGELNAATGSFAGSITAEQGTIGGFNIGSDLSSTVGTLVLKGSSGQITGSEVQFTGGEIAGWGISNTQFTSPGSDIILDSSNEQISIGDSTFGQQGIQLDIDSNGHPRLFAGTDRSFFRFENGSVELNNVSLKVSQNGLRQDIYDVVNNKRVALSSDTIDYVTYEPNTTITVISGSDQVKETITVSQQYTLGSISTVSAGDIIDADKPVSFLQQGRGHELPAYSMAGKLFFAYASRNHPIQFDFYSPFGDAAVTASVGNNNDGQFDSGSISTTVNQYSVSSVDVPGPATNYIKVESNLPIIVQSQESGGSGDSTTHEPAATEILHADQSTATAIIPTSSADYYDANSNSDYYFSNYPFGVQIIGDASGGDTDKGIPLDGIGDTYIIPHEVNGYQITAVESTKIKAYEITAGGGKTLIDTIDLSNSSKDSPGFYTTGSDFSGGSGISANPMLFEGTAPFALRTQDVGSDEYHVYGYRRTQTSQYVNSTTIKGDLVRTGEIQSNNWDGSTNGSLFNLNGGTLHLGGSGSNASLYFDGTNLFIEGEVSASSGEIGGWSINPTTLTGGNVTLDSDGNISINDTVFGNDGIQLQNNGGNPRFYAGNGSGQFIRFNGTDLSWQGTNTSLTTGGVFSASDAYIDGTIVANNGTIGGFTISNTEISASGLVMKSSGQITGSAVFFSGSSNTFAGNITASNLRIDNNFSLGVSQSIDTGGALLWDSGKIGTLGLTLDYTSVGGLIFSGSTAQETSVKWGAGANNTFNIYAFDSLQGSGPSSDFRDVWVVEATGSDVSTGIDFIRYERQYDLAGSSVNNQTLTLKANDGIEIGDGSSNVLSIEPANNQTTLSHTLNLDQSSGGRLIIPVGTDQYAT